MKIFKWPLGIVDAQTIFMPAGAKLLTVQVQDLRPQLWALCSESVEYEQRNIAIYGTGHPLPTNYGEYIATFQMNGGALVFHAFEVGG